MRNGSALGPSTSFSMIGTQLIRQIPRQLELHAGIVDRDVRRQDQRIAVALSPTELWITAAIRRNTPRVRWNFTSVDQSV